MVVHLAVNENIVGSNPTLSAMNIKKPKSWRKGQTIFNFFEWLNTDKEYGTNQSPRMADTFHIPDKEFDKLWKEYLIHLGVEKNGTSKKK